MRELLDAREKGRRRADVAFRMFCYRVKKYIGAYTAAMGGADAVVFTGGIGENSPEVREWTLDGMDYMGLDFDADRNTDVVGREGEICTATSRVKALVIPTNEEKTIARDVVRVIEGVMPSFEPPETFD
jgi:acetate kinase